MSVVVEAAARGAGRSKSITSTKPNMEIKLDQHYSSRVYTSGSTISGHAVICTSRDIPFNKFEIVFTGVVVTRLEFVQSYTSNSVRTFMKLRMPIPPGDLPEPQVFQAGRTYNVPFNFVVPHQLTINACNHGNVPPAVKEQHLRLPPSVGCWEGDDQAPEMTQIEYAVKARAWAPSGSGSSTTVLDAKRLLKVFPALPEDAPLDITSKDERYCMAKTKTFRKNLIAGKLGKLTISGTQPGAVILSGDAYGGLPTTARVNLDFAPSSTDSTPPKINSVTGKLHTTTFFGGAPIDKLPNLGSRASYSANPCLTYANTRTLFNNNIDKVSWTQEAAAVDRRDSGYSTGAPDEDATESDVSDGQGRTRDGAKKNAKKSRKPPIRYAAVLDIPVSIPVSNKKMFLPTFHNCLISRTYVLQLTFSVGPANTTMTLSLPLQLAVETMYNAPGEELPSFEDAIAQAEAAEADGHLQSQLFQIPRTSLRGNNILPDYEEHAHRYIQVA